MSGFDGTVPFVFSPRAVQGSRRCNGSRIYVDVDEFRNRIKILQNTIDNLIKRIEDLESKI